MLEELISQGKYSSLEAKSIMKAWSYFSMKNIKITTWSNLFLFYMEKNVLKGMPQYFLYN